MDRRLRPAVPRRLVSAGTAGIASTAAIPASVSAGTAGTSSVPSFNMVQAASSGAVPSLISHVTLNERESVP